MDKKTTSIAKSTGIKFFCGLIALVLAMGLIPLAAFKTNTALANDGSLRAGLSASEQEAVRTGDVEAGYPTVWGDIVIPPIGAPSEEKQVINLNGSAGDVTLYTDLRFIASSDSDQPLVQETFDNLPVAQKYAAECFEVLSTDEKVLSVSYNLTGGTPELTLTAHQPGVTELNVRYNFEGYHADYHRPVWVVESDNPATSISAAATTMDLWVAKNQTDKLTSYYYEYANKDPFPSENTIFQIACTTKFEDAPSTYWQDQLFDVSIANTNVLSSVIVDGRGYNQHIYNVYMEAKAAGTTDVTFSLKSDPSKSIKVKVTVHNEAPKVIAKDYTTEVGKTTHIYPQDYNNGDACPIRIDKKIVQFYWRVSPFSSDYMTPYITEATSSDEAVMKIQKVESPSYSLRYAPFDFIALSEGKATVTLTDYAGTKTEYTVTVSANAGDPNASAVTGVSLDRDKLELETTDIDGVALTATVTATDSEAHPITWRSSNTDVAIVNEAGVVVPKSAGDCIVTAAAGGKAATCSVKVKSKAMCQSDPNSPLGEVAIVLPNAPSKEILEELKGLTLSVTSIAKGDNENVDNALEALKKEGNEVHGVYDIHFNNANGEEHAWNKPNFPINVRVPLTKEMRDSYKRGQLAFYHVNDATGERTKMRTWVEGDYVFFETTHFSPFALVTEPATDNTTNTLASVNNGEGTPKTGDTIMTLVPCTIVLMLGALVVLIFARRRMNAQ